GCAPPPPPAARPIPLAPPLTCARLPYRQGEVHVAEDVISASHAIGLVLNLAPTVSLACGIMERIAVRFCLAILQDCRACVAGSIIRLHAGDHALPGVV